MDSDKQTKMAFMEEGGIADDGMDRDPVSGNEIPPGSLAEEVRDDIPAQLSEGEYVVPADVLRYYGVRFFEDLRDQAKQGMAQMEADGRIGGEPVPSGGPTDGPLTPEEMAVLESMGMNVGGFVPQQPAPQAVGNTMQQPQPMSKGYSPGGLEDGSAITQPANTQQSLQQQFPLGFSLFGTGTQSQSNEVFKIVNLYSPDGTMRSLTLPTDQEEYDRLIAEGWSKEATGVTTETSVGKEDRGGGEPSTTGSGSPSVSIGDMNATQVANAFSSTYDPDSLGAKAAPTVAGLLAGPIAALAARGVNALNSNQRDALQAQAEALGLDLSTISDPNQDLSRDNFKSDAFFSQAMESVAPPGMSYNESTGGYEATGSLAPTSSPTPSSISGHPSNQGTESESTGLQGIADSISNAVSAVADALGISGNSDSSNDGNSGASGSTGSTGGAETGADPTR